MAAAENVEDANVPAVQDVANTISMTSWSLDWLNNKLALNGICLLLCKI